MQVSTSVNNTRKVLKIKETFPDLHAKKIENIQKIINSEDKTKPRLHMMTKELLRKQVIVPISNDNSKKFMVDLSAYISNINKAFKNIKSEVKADFIQVEQSGIVIVANKVAAQLDFQTIEQYVKNTNQIEVDNVKMLCLPQSKLYLKIIGIPYLLKNTNMPITVDMIKMIIKNNHIFNNITVALRPRVIKVFSKSDMAIIWLNI